MKELNNYQVQNLDSTELQKIEGGIITVSKKLVNGLAFAAGVIVGFVGEMAE